ncbi:MAG: cation-transporting P-type ATPase [Sphingobacteriales bacterium]|nr:MAG: cation-transporting P-type ATPase [Sphingobacteriales bacterium]
MLDQDVLATEKLGLSEAEAQERLLQFGTNEVHQTSKRSVLLVFFDQFRNLLVLMLVAAALLSFLLAADRDGVILLLVVFFNAWIGFYQDWKAENILQSLKSLVIEKCTVYRNGRQIEAPSSQLVPGDLVYLTEGSGVPADIRVTEATGFTTNDFILTGETVPSEKSPNPGADRIFMGTNVAKGEARGIVAATGMRTELGRIAQKSESMATEATPLQKELNQVARRITVITLVLGTILFAVRLFQGDRLNEALIFTIGVAAAMVPEGLPAQISISLALGVSRLAKKRAVVKKISAVEALGAATVIASDKTGTLTRNEMTILHCFLDGQNFTCTGNGFSPQGAILNLDGSMLSPDQKERLKLPLLSGFLASTGRVNPPDAFHTDWYAIGDPTESAFSTLAMKAGFVLEEAEREFPRIQLFPFDSERKRMTVIRQSSSGPLCFLKGAMESIVQISEYRYVQGNQIPFTSEEKRHLLEMAQLEASEGKRIIALGFRKLPGASSLSLEEIESGITLIGFASMIDPPHEGAAVAVSTAFDAGMKVFMITGDNEITARAIADRIGMVNADGTLPRVINQAALRQMTDDELKTSFTARCLIFSRTSPDEKLRIISLLKDSGEVVAVTGDGVNDTLSLKRSDIGIAMGNKGSKVAQEAANMVLLDDNFATIVDAIREGRTIYNNLRKNVMANMIGNWAELSVILLGFVAIFWQTPMAIYPVHILLIDLIGNMLPLLMLSYDPPEGDIMHQPPRKANTMLGRKELVIIGYSGLAKGVISFAAYLFAYRLHEGGSLRHETAVTVTMASIICCQFVNIMSTRTAGTVFSRYFFSNGRLLWGILCSFLFILLVSYTPFFNRHLHTGPMTAIDWALVWVGMGIYLLFLEATKHIRPYVRQSSHRLTVVRNRMKRVK